MKQLNIASQVSFEFHIIACDWKCVEVHSVLSSKLRCAYNHMQEKETGLHSCGSPQREGIPPSPKNNACTSITSQECFNICQNAQSLRFVEKIHWAQLKVTGRYVVVSESSGLYVGLCTQIATSVRTWYTVAFINAAQLYYPSLGLRQ